MNGEGRYSWVDTDGALRHSTHWDDLPAEMDRLVAFVPDYPEPPHTPEEHELMETYDIRLKEIMARCRR